MLDLGVYFLFIFVYSLAPLNSIFLKKHVHIVLAIV